MIHLLPVLRFLPDGFVEGLLRPLAMIDPAGYVYAEFMAPDWRPALLMLALAAGAVVGRVRRHASLEQAKLLIGFLVCFYVWTFVIGNGRYFVAWLLIVGPLLVMATRWLPGSAAFRWVSLGLAILVQAIALGTSYTADAWGLARWVQGPGINVESSPLRSRPAVFLTLSTITYSILIPKFDPRSRWANVAGQADIRPGMREYPELMSLLASDQPKYVVLPVLGGYREATQPSDEVWEVIKRSLAPFGVEPTAEHCETLRSSVAPGPIGKEDQDKTYRGFWFCPVASSAPGVAMPAKPAARAEFELDHAFSSVEQRCPRFFPIGGGQERISGGVAMRHYAGSEVTVYIDGTGQVFYRYSRALNPTRIGTVKDVRSGKFEIDCEKLPGRYRFPWQSE